MQSIDITLPQSRPMRTAVHNLLVLVVLAASASGCIARQVRDLQDRLEDSRAPDTRKGVLDLDPVSQARIELIGRTSAPTRYAERTDANRVRVVAFDFGGAKIGQNADTAGNLLPLRCFEPGSESKKYVEIYPTKMDFGEPPPKGNPESIELYKGMFRQYGRQVGTTVEAEADIGPAGVKSRVYFSHNFLVLEWRRYQLERLIDPQKCPNPHVSAIEQGIAVRIIFDVRLRTIDAKLSAAFGIADLAVALARSEATVEVSYELVGTRLDLLPHDAIIITSVNEYMNALKNFHAAVTTISDAWRDYNLRAKDGGAKNVNATIKVKTGDKELEFDRSSLFAPDQLAYYVDGIGVGDTFLHLENVELCQDIKSIEKDFSDRKDEIDAEIKNLDVEIDALDKAIPKLQRTLGKREELKKSKKSRREKSIERDALNDESKLLTKRIRGAKTNSAESDCDRTMANDKKRVAYICAAANVAADAKDKPIPYIGSEKTIRGQIQTQNREMPPPGAMEPGQQQQEAQKK